MTEQKIKKVMLIVDEFKEQIHKQNFRQAVIIALDLAILSKELRDGKR